MEQKTLELFVGQWFTPTIDGSHKPIEEKRIILNIAVDVAANEL